MFIFRNPPVYYSAPGAPVGGGGEPAQGSPQQGQPTPQQPQPGAPGQGPGQGDGFRQQYFPNVPDEVWGQIEPHIQNVNKHVTQLEQRYAPFKGYTPQAVQGLAQFAQAFDRDPVGQWIRLAHALQSQGTLDPELDLEHLAALAAGQEPPEEEEFQGNPQQQGQMPGPSQEEMPPWAQQFLERQDRLEQGLNQFQQTQRQRAEDVALKRQLGHMKEQMKQGGIPEDVLSEEYLLSSYIAHRGNLNKAVETAVNMRNSMLKGFTGDPNQQQQQRKDKDLDLPNGTPKTGKKSGGRTRGFLGEANKAAEQALRRAAQE